MFSKISKSHYQSVLLAGCLCGVHGIFMVEFIMCVLNVAQENYQLLNWSYRCFLVNHLSPVIYCKFYRILCCICLPQIITSISQSCSVPILFVHFYLSHLDLPYSLRNNDCMIILPRYIY